MDPKVTSKIGMAVLLLYGNGTTRHSTYLPFGLASSFFADQPSAHQKHVQLPSLRRRDVTR